MDTQFAALLAFAEAKEGKVALFEVAAKRVKVTVSAAHGPVAAIIGYRTAQETKARERFSLKAGEQQAFEEAGPTMLAVVVRCTGSAKDGTCWAHVHVVVEELAAPKALAVRPYRRYPHKTHRRKSARPWSQPPRPQRPLSETLGTAVADLINLPVGDKLALARAVAIMTQARAMEVAATPPGELQVTVRQPQVRRISRPKYDKNGEIVEIETISIPVKEAD